MKQIDVIVTLEHMGFVPVVFYFSSDKEALDELRILSNTNGSVFSYFFKHYPLVIDRVLGNPEFSDMKKPDKFFFFRTISNSDTVTFGNDLDARNVCDYLSGITDELNLVKELDWFSKAKLSGKFKFNINRIFKPSAGL